MHNHMCDLPYVTVQYGKPQIKGPIMYAYRYIMHHDHDQIWAKVATYFTFTALLSEHKLCNNVLFVLYMILSIMFSQNTHL